MADVFISYAREDVRTAQALAAIFQNNSWSVWWDHRLKAGDVWDKVIQRQLTDAQCVVVLWSSTSVSKHWVCAEAAEGLERGILVPALIDRVRPPLMFRPIQAEDLTDWNGDTDHLGLLRLLNAVSGHLSYTKKSTDRAAKPNAELPANAETSATPILAMIEELKLLLVFALFALGLYWCSDNSKDHSQRAERRPAFSDCESCPVMVALPGGTFLMGSPDDEVGRSDSEEAQHQVTVRPFAIGRFEVRFEQWDSCFNAGPEACNGYLPDDEGWGRRTPVMNVSWHDAKAYADWLAKMTGKPYRLPTEAEWEYAARAGTTTPNAMGRASEDYCRTGFGNAWSLYNMHGSVWEWVEDCWRESYRDPPRNGLKNACSYRTVRGGSTGDPPFKCRSATRGFAPSTTRAPNPGFRVALTLD